MIEIHYVFEDESAAGFDLVTKSQSGLHGRLIIDLWTSAERPLRQSWKRDSKGRAEGARVDGKGGRRGRANPALPYNGRTERRALVSLFGFRGHAEKV